MMRTENMLAVFGNVGVFFQPSTLAPAHLTTKV